MGLMILEIPSFCSDSVIWCTRVYCCPSWFEIKLEPVSERQSLSLNEQNLSLNVESDVLYRNSCTTEDASFVSFPFQLSLDLIEFTASTAMQMEYFFFDYSNLLFQKVGHCNLIALC